MMEDLKLRIKKVSEKFNIEEKRKKIREIEAESTHPDFWKDHQNASSKMKELSTLQGEILKVEKLTELSTVGNLQKRKNF